MQARFSSRCPDCLQQIKQGDPINYVKGQPATHLECVPADESVRAAVQATEKANLTTVVKWLADNVLANTADDFEKSLFEQYRVKGRLSEKQVGACMRKIERQRTPGMVATAVGPVIVPLLPAGRYAVEYQGVWRFIRIWRGTRDPSVQQVYEVHGTERGVRIDSDPGLLAAIASDPMKAAVAFGHRFGRCGRCGLELDVNLTRFMGIGPVCIKHYDPEGRLNRIDRARTILRSVGIEPDASNDDLEPAFNAEKALAS